MGFPLNAAKIIELAESLNELGDAEQLERDKRVIGVVISTISAMQNMLLDGVFNLELDSDVESFSRGRLNSIFNGIRRTGEKCIKIADSIYSTENWVGGDLEGTIEAVKKSADVFADKICEFAGTIACRARIINQQEDRPVQEMVDIFMNLFDSAANVIYDNSKKGYISTCIESELLHAYKQLDRYMQE